MKNPLKYPPCFNCGGMNKYSKGGLFKGAETYAEELAEAKALKSKKISPAEFVKGEKSEGHKGEEKNLAKIAKDIASGVMSPSEYAKMEAAKPNMKRGGGAINKYPKGGSIKKQIKAMTPVQNPNDDLWTDTSTGQTYNFDINKANWNRMRDNYMDYMSAPNQLMLYDFPDQDSVDRFNALKGQFVPPYYKDTQHMVDNSAPQYKKGGWIQNYEVNKDYELTEQEIQNLIKQGYKIQRY